MNLPTIHWSRFKDGLSRASTGDIYIGYIRYSEHNSIAWYSTFYRKNHSCYSIDYNNYGIIVARRKVEDKFYKWLTEIFIFFDPKKEIIWVKENKNHYYALVNKVKIGNIIKLTDTYMATYLLSFKTIIYNDLETAKQMIESKYKDTLEIIRI